MDIEPIAQVTDSAPSLNDKGVDPAPLALIGLAISSLFCGLFCFSELEMDIVVLLAIASGGIAMLIGGMMEFKNHDLLGFTGFTLLGMLWIILSIQLYVNGDGILIAPKTFISMLMVV